MRENALKPKTKTISPISYLMTPIGHSLVGMSMGVVCMPRYQSCWAKAAFLSGFIGLATVPDWHLPGWGHIRYEVSHSLFVNLALIIVFAVVLRTCKSTRMGIGAWPVIFGGAAAWLSHLLMDSFYNHGLGVTIFWPLSTARLALPMPWFRTLPYVPPPWDFDTFCIYLVEVLFYGPILLLAIAWRYWRLRRLSRKEHYDAE